MSVPSIPCSSKDDGSQSLAPFKQLGKFVTLTSLAQPDIVFQWCEEANQHMEDVWKQQVQTPNNPPPSTLYTPFILDSFFIVRLIELVFKDLMDRALVDAHFSVSLHSIIS